MRHYAYQGSYWKKQYGSIPNFTNVKNYLNAIQQQFETSNKALACALMSKLSSIKSKGTKIVLEHITKMRDIAAQLKFLQINIFERFLVDFIHDSLPYEYGLFKTSYNTHKEKQSITELLTLCVKKERRLSQERMENVHTLTHGKKNDQTRKRKGKASLS